MANKKVKLVGITSNFVLDTTWTPEGVPTVQERMRYCERVIDCCETDMVKPLPVIIPALGETMLPIVEKLDGIIFTGSPSNVHPDNYKGHAPRADNIADQRRDQTTLPLIRAAMERGLPLLCICRGAQELNVALGGSLHQHVEELPGKMDHRYKYVDGQSYDYGFRAVHGVTIQPGGLLEKIYNGQMTWQINSAHGQGVDRLADSLRVEAVADDGIIEAFSYPGYKNFLLGLQWHPEQAAVINEWHNKILFHEFAKHL